MSKKITVWVFSVKFPSGIQPWLANLVSQIPKNGSDIKIFSSKKGDKNYARVVDEYQLIDKTEYLDSFGLKMILMNFLNPKRTLHTLRGLFNSDNAGSQNKSKLNNLASRLILAPYFVKGRVDIIHSHFEAVGHKLLPIVKAQGVPFVITFHGLPPPNVNQLSNNMRREYMQHASVILVNTEFAKRQYANLGADEKKIKILPQGTDIEKFSFFRKSHPGKSTLKILTVGRFSEDKGQKYAMEGIAKLIKKGFNIEYTLIGEGLNKNNLIQFADELGISQFIRFKSSLSEQDIIKHYHEAHIFVLPSLRAFDGCHEETQGVVLQEAQACGAIVIATRVGGIPECVQDGESAFLVEDRNSDAIAEKIEWIMNNPQKWDEWQANARKHVEENYDINLIGCKMMALYNQLLSSNS